LRESDSHRFPGPLRMRSNLVKRRCLAENDIRNHNCLRAAMLWGVPNRKVFKPAPNLEGMSAFVTFTSRAWHRVQITLTVFAWPDPPP
jgi:hypothetical protein